MGESPLFQDRTAIADAFVAAVLALHRRLDFPALGASMCACGASLDRCEVRAIATVLGLLAETDPAGNTSGAAGGR